MTMKKNLIDEDYNSDALVTVGVNDDEEFVKNVDVNAEYGGLVNVESQPKQSESTFGNEVNYSDEGSLIGSEDEAAGFKWTKYLQDIEGSCPKFALGLTFKDKKEFREAITNYAIKEGKEMKYEKNDKVRCVVKCKHESCPWKVTLRYDKDDKFWKITVLNEKHDGCVRTKKNSMVNSTIVAKRWKQEIKGHLDWKTNAFLKKVCIDDHYTLSKKQAWRALVKAKGEIRHEAEDYFNKIWSYCMEIERTNPKCTYKVKLSELQEDGKDRFLRMYICWEAMKEGFKHCRRIIGLDGCHLKCKTGGQLLTAVGIDGNESIFPIAYAIVEGENKNSWTWFLGLLKTDLQIHDMVQNEFTMMSDKQKGLIEAFEVVLPGVRHRFCVRHLHCNMRVAGFTAKTIRDALWKAARATTVNYFTVALQELRNLDEDAFAWLADKHPSEWSRSHFTGTSSCDILVNNISESFNAMILTARENPVINCLEIIRKKLMSSLFEFRCKAAEWSGIVCPNIVKKIDDIELLAGGLNGYQCSPMLFEILGTQSGQFTVDLGRRACSCRKWDLTGIPCQHAVCAIWMKHGKGPIWHYVDSCYLIFTYKKTYEGCINPMSGYEDWPITSRQPPLPPLYKAKAGRPRKLRMKSKGEISNDGVHLSRRHVTLHCKKCKELGHNSRKCPKYPTVKPANQFKRRTSRGVAAATVQADQPQLQAAATVQVSAATVQVSTATVHELDVITQPEVEDNQWEIPDDVLDAHWHQIEIQTQDIDGGASLSNSMEIPVITIPFEQAEGSKGKQVMQPNIPRKRTAPMKLDGKKQPVKKYATRL
ncbi:PREDICTED: uncharacterized protein LOC109190938 [Ipomoea nil]|uniref:uncharacterized protein LOC109190938 n=1 Tax=Ipomoea nil TaxID=35883 RepID=UPI0009011D1F|nr:PREDICTED: uncharacterized protein LOC109190938 [Ipomoea nil]